MPEPDTVCEHQITLGSCEQPMKMLAALHRDRHPSLSMSFTHHPDRKAVQVNVSALQCERFTEPQSGIKHQHEQRPHVRGSLRNYGRNVTIRLTSASENTLIGFGGFGSCLIRKRS